MRSISGTDGDERRHGVRYPAGIPCRMLWDDGEEPATLCDLSSHGVMLHGFYMPPIGTRVTIIAEWLEVIGTVAWLGLDQAGILLSHEIDPLIYLQRPARNMHELLAAH